MENLKQVQKLVEVELTENEAARGCDAALIMGVFKRQGIDVTKSFAELAVSGQLRHMESITRARRKVQSMHPELKDIPVAGLRAEREELFREYSKTTF